MIDALVLELPPDVHAPAVARQWVRERTGDLPGHVIADAEVLVSELVTNAVLHGLPTITLQLRLHPPGIGVAVHDAGGQIPEQPHAVPEPSKTSGRGLLIVAAMSSRWGIASSDDEPGKTVWFELDP